MLSAAERLLARERTYALFSRLYNSGISPEVWPALRAIPQLAAHLPAELDVDRAAADHYFTFSNTVLPYESVFRDTSGLIGGEISTAVATVYNEYGFAPLAEADMIGAELAFLAYLCRAERQARAASEWHEAGRWQAAQSAFLEEHLLAWLPPFAAALANGRWPFFAALGHLTLALAADHLASLGTREASIPALPDAPPLLEDDDTSLRLISRTVLTPSYSGLYLSREAISMLARTNRLPRGFGQRRQMLRNLLETAGQYDSVIPLLDDLLEMTVNFDAAYHKQRAVVPLLVPWIRPWQAQLSRMQSVLREMRLILESGT